MDSTLLFGMGALLISIVLAQSVALFSKAWKQGLAIGMDRGVLQNVVKSSAIFSIVPSIPIVIGLVTMVPLLGIALPWIRLSVIGAVQYELFAADAAAKAAGLTSLSEGLSASAFASAAWIMTLSIIGGLILVIFFLRKYMNRIEAFHKKNARLAEIVIAALFMGLVSTIGAQQVARGGMYLVALLLSMGFMAIFGVLVRKFKWLESFALPISMLATLIVVYILVV